LLDCQRIPMGRRGRKEKRKGGELRVKERRRNNREGKKREVREKGKGREGLLDCQRIPMGRRGRKEKRRRTKSKGEREK
jgi:hypothetical protein